MATSRAARSDSTCRRTPPAGASAGSSGAERRRPVTQRGTMEPQATRPDEGFTLIELMVVVAIATILLSIAIPNYMNYARQSRRSEAKTALLDLAGREESYFSTNGTAYTNVAASLGFNAAWGAAFGSGYYSM